MDSLETLVLNSLHKLDTLACQLEAGDNESTAESEMSDSSVWSSLLSSWWLPAISRSSTRKFQPPIYSIISTAQPFSAWSRQSLDRSAKSLLFACPYSFKQSVRASNAHSAQQLFSWSLTTFEQTSLFETVFSDTNKIFTPISLLSQQITVLSRC